MPTVSIVLPTYNGSQYIRQSLASIIGQTYTDWELIIVDDCSTDHTLEIAHEYECRDSRITVIHNEINRKLPEALNIGFHYSKGKYLTWTSDDNMYLPEALAVMVKYLDESDTPMVCAGEYIVDEFGQVRPEIIRRYEDCELYLHNIIGACFLYRREVWDIIGTYDTDLFGAEDYDYWLRIKKKYGKIERINNILYKYRSHRDSLSFSKKDAILSVLIKLRRKHIDFLLDNLKEKEDLLRSFYYELLETNSIQEADIREKIFDYLPDLKNDRVSTAGKYIVFGAGEYGEKAFRILNEDMYSFADNNPDKVGAQKNGKKILSFEEMVSLAGQFNIMIAVYYDKVPQLFHQLSENGIHQYCTLQTYMAEYGDGIAWTS